MFEFQTFTVFESLLFFRINNFAYNIVSNKFVFDIRALHQRVDCMKSRQFFTSNFLYGRRKSVLVRGKLKINPADCKL